MCIAVYTDVLVEHLVLMPESMFTVFIVLNVELHKHDLHRYCFISLNSRIYCDIRISLELPCLKSTTTKKERKDNKYT